VIDRGGTVCGISPGGRGQRSKVNIKFFYYVGAMQEACLRLMGKKLLVSLAI